jgi:hypothetical protein
LIFIPPALVPTHADVSQTRARYATARTLLNQAYGAIDLAYAKCIAAHHDTTALCRHRPLNDLDTISAAIYLPAQRRLVFCNGWPCQGSYETYRLRRRKTKDGGHRSH